MLPLHKETKSSDINFTTTNRSSAGGFSPVQSNFEHNKITYEANIFNYAATEVPAIDEEPYLTTIGNYTTKIKFELASVDFSKIGGSCSGL